jgi:phage gp46-like protein
MDIDLKFDESGYADISFSNGDVTVDYGLDQLATSVMLSLFTDRIASSDFKPTDGTNDRRGVWFDSYLQQPLGSRLWQLYRSKITSDTGPLLQARGFCLEALNWLITDGIAATVNVSCSWINKNSMAIQVTVTEPFTSVAHKFLYSWAWKTEAKPSPNPPGSYYIIPPTPDTADKVLLLESGSFVLYEDGDLEALEDISTLPGVHLENGDFWLLESGNYWIN